MKWITITSDEISSGKTVFAAYIAALLDKNKIKINYIKLNPALSIKLGLLSPESVGEAFITHDGGQVDKDIGIIERSISYDLPARSCLTLGHAIDQVNLTELDSKDCGFEFLSIDKQLIDFIYQYIKEFKDYVVNLIEIGGSVHESGGNIFCEAVKRLMRSHSIYTIHIGSNTSAFEQVFGEKPSIFVDYAEHCNHLRERIIDVNLENELREMMESYLEVRLIKFNLNNTYLAQAQKNVYQRTIKISIIGRYISNESAYLSILDNLRAAARSEEVNILFNFVEPLYLNRTNSCANLSDSSGIVIPGGFGDCGNDGMLEAIRFGRENKIPTLGICYGFQMMVVEFARHVCGMADAHTFEVNPSSKHPVVHILGWNPAKEEEELNEKYRTMNLGDCKIFVLPGTIAAGSFEDGEYERHWHSYGVNMHLWPELEAAGMLGSVFNEDHTLVLAAELKESEQFFFGCQFHPEFRGKYNQNHNIFSKFTQAAALLSNASDLKE